MSTQHLIRVGVLGHVGRFDSADTTRYPRGRRVICRTGRGLEIGEVLAPNARTVPADILDGTIVRAMSVEDELLQARLEKDKQAAVEQCAEKITASGSTAVLLDAEMLFDATGLYFYFLGEVTPEVEALTGELAEVYEAKVQYGKFAAAVVEGCGPGCGTEDATGGGCTVCLTGCSLSKACGSAKAPPVS
jgi:cell fate regulator YaaT (PSP1 superfamily)